MIKLEVVRKHYRVEETGDPRAPYILHGKRGATYGLMRQLHRNSGKPKLDQPMFCVNLGGIRGKMVRLFNQSNWVVE